MAFPTRKSAAEHKDACSGTLPTDCCSFSVCTPSTMIAATTSLRCFKPENAVQEHGTAVCAGLSIIPHSQRALLAACHLQAAETALCGRASLDKQASALTWA